MIRDTKNIRAMKWLCVAVLLLAAFLPNSAQGQVVNRGPYLQQGTPTSVVVRWRTSTLTDSQVRYGTQLGNLSLTASVADIRTEHVVALSGLQADTQYFYSVGNAAGPLVGGDSEHTFRTSPPTGTAKATRIWVLGDSGTANANARAVRDAFLDFTGPRVPDLWLMLGDNAYNDGTDNEYQNAVFNMYPTVLRKSVLWSTIGNHDARTSNVYFNVFTLPTSGEAGGQASGTENYYSFDYGNIHFVVLDSQLSNRLPTGAMLTWLRDDLGANTLPWTIALFHHPPYSKGSHNSDTEGQLIDMRQNALPILEAGGVDLVLSGHSHSYERSFLLDGHYDSSGTLRTSMVLDSGDGRPAGNGAYQKLAGPSFNDGAVYAVAGSSGKTSGGLLNHPAMFVSVSFLGSMVLDVNGDQLDATFLRSTGAVADTFTIMKGPGLPPVVTGVASADLTDTSARIIWSTDKAADSRVDYGPTTAYGLQASDPSLAMSHSLALAGLTPDTTYHYRVTSADSSGQATSSADFTFTTLPFNNPPTALADSTTTDEDNAVTIPVLLNDSDLDGDPVAIASVAQPAHGIALANADGTVTYTPNADFSGADAFTYTVTDGKGGTAGANVSVTVLSVNDPPVAADQSVVTVESTAAAITLTAGDVEGDTLTFLVVTQPTEGVLSGTPPDLTYTPNFGFLGVDSFTFQADDGLAASNLASVSVNVVPRTPIEQNLQGGNKIEVNQGQRGAQSFRHGAAGDPDYRISRVVLHLSRDLEAPDRDLSFSIGTAANAGAILGSGITISPAQVTNDSEGASFESFEIQFGTPVGPLTAGTTYFLSFEADSPNGKKYYLEYAGASTYANGTYFKSGSDDGKDIWFQIWDGGSAPPPQFALPVGAVGQGSVALDPAGGVYDAGMAVTLTATPAAGWQFDSWSGALTGSQNPATLTMDADKSVTAHFSEAPANTVALTVGVSGQGSVDPPGGSFTVGSVIMLTATPASGWRFDSWSGALTGSQNPAILTMDTAKSVTANFSLIPVGEQLLTENSAGGDKMEVNEGQSGAQSFRVGSAGDPDFQISKVVLHLSRDSDVPDRDLALSIGTGVQTGTLAGSVASITPAEVADTSAGVTFNAFEVTFAAPIGPLSAGTTYFLNLEAESPNGAKYYLEYDSDSGYTAGTYFKNSSDDGKDLHFQVWGASVP